MPCLCSRCRDMTRMSRGFFCSGRACGCSTGSAVVADAVSRALVAYGFYVSVVNRGHIYVIHRRVVAELVVYPVSAFVAGTAVAKAIVNAAIEADSGAPVTLVPSKCTAAPAPITRSPEQANAGRLDPCAGHPEIAVGTVRPETRRPQIAVLGTNGLRVCYQHGGSDGDRDADLCKQRGRYGQYHKKKEQKTNEAVNTHLHHLAISSFACPILRPFFGLRGLTGYAIHSDQDFQYGLLTRTSYAPLAIDTTNFLSKQVPAKSDGFRWL